MDKAYFTAEEDAYQRQTRSPNNSEASWEEIDSITLEKLSSANSSYQTPKTLQIGTLLEALSDTMPIGVGRAEVPVTNVVDPSTVEDTAKRESLEAESLRMVLWHAPDIDVRVIPWFVHANVRVRSRGTWWWTFPSWESWDFLWDFMWEFL
jgi:hypothetical protein